ncbi:tetratricopeptide repeat protein [Nocardia sp. NPDC058640]|uniref:tetratricopeptide repeat protein n=1 Tax=Nocardia sp. NPDC058640 TaxID=3346571 RepID=UPI00364CA460
MGGRLALVVASQCAALGTQRQINDIDVLAQQLLSELSEHGGWESVTGDGNALLDPTRDQLLTAISAAFDAAAQQNATLLFSFVGHGVYHPQGLAYYLLAKDSPEVPNADGAIDLGYRIKTCLDRRDNYSLDGLIVMVDACASGGAIDRASDEWVAVIPRNAGRLELLTAAADDQPAYDACFTRTALKTLREGDVQGNSVISVDSLRAPIARGCRRVEPGHMSLTMSGAALATRGGDPGLWLVPNAARGDCLKDRPSAGLVDQLTRDLFWTENTWDAVAELVNHKPPRLRVVVGPAGSGKSAIMGLLIRATKHDNEQLIPEKYVSAAVFLDAASSPSSVAEELVAQLSRTLPGFPEAAERVASMLSEEQLRTRGPLERLVMLPFAAVATKHAVHIIVDGLDQPDHGNRDELLSAITAMTTDAAARHLCIIIGVRAGTVAAEDPRLDSAYRVTIELPSVQAVVNATIAVRGGITKEDLAGTRISDAPISGGWLISRLLAEISRLPANWSSADDSVLARAVAQRIDDASAPADDGTPSKTSAASIRRLLAVLLAVGVGPVLPFEVAQTALIRLGGSGISESTLRNLITSLGSLIARTAPKSEEERIGLAHLAFRRPIAGHIAGDLAAAHLAIADSLTSQGSTQMLAYRTKAGARHLALGGRVGDALALTEHLLPDHQRILGPDHPDVLRIRNNIAYWRGETGDLVGALTAFELLLSDCQRILGADHPDTLEARSNIASWRGESGDIPGALTSAEHLLPDQQRILGHDHPDTLRTRSNIAFCRGRSGDTTGAIAAFGELLTDRCRVLGPDHPDTFRTRSNIASWLGISGDFTAALAYFEQLLHDQHRVLGRDHPDTLRIRSNIANCYSRSGNSLRALAAFEQLVTDQQRILGHDHPNTLLTRSSLASLQEQSGTTASTPVAVKQRFADYTRAIGSPTFDTVRIREWIRHLRRGGR